jgi:hypothetical protein
LALNIKDVEKFLSFPIVIYTPCYDKQSRSYDFSNINQAAEILY